MAYCYEKYTIFQVITDYQLFMVVGVLLFVDLVIMTTWQVADPFYRETKEMDAYVSKTFLHDFKAKSRIAWSYSELTVIINFLYCISLI